MKRKIGIIVLGGFAALALITASCVGPSRTAHVVPLRGIEPGGNRADLAPLGTIIGDACVVALGEPAHGVHEPLAFRNRLFEYLVEELGFTAIAVECAFPESRRLADYVVGGPGTAEEVVGGNPSWSPQTLEENVQLVRWLRAYNTTSGRRHPVRFYAIDLSYTGPWGSRPTPAGLEAALAYLVRVDGTAGRSFGAIFEPWLRRLADPNISLTTSEHDALTAAIDDLIALLERERVTYLAAAPAADYEWAHQAAIVVRQANRMWRVAPTGSPNGPVPPSAWRMVNSRDAAMAENVLWVLRQEGLAGRVLVVAHNVHVQSAPTAGGPWSALEQMPTSMGQHLSAALGNSLFVIGMSEAKSAQHMTPALERAVPYPFLVNLRTVRTDAAAARTLVSDAAFDALFVIDSLTPARLLHTSH